MPDGFLLKARYSIPIHVGPEKFLPLEPVAVFRVSEPGVPDSEKILTASSLHGVMEFPGEPDFVWVIYRPTFAGNFCTLAEIDRETWGNGIQEVFPASYRVDFASPGAKATIDGKQLEWIGNGLTIQHGKSVKLLVADREIKFPAATVQLHSLHGRSYFRLRVDKKTNIKIFQE